MFRAVFSLFMVSALALVPCVVQAQTADASLPDQILGLTPIELGVIIAVIVAVIGVVGFALYQRAQLRSIQKKTAVLKAKTEELRARQRQPVRLQSVNVCQFCRASIKEGTVFCPVCHRALK